jgi:hypothetical protein
VLPTGIHSNREIGTQRPRRAHYPCKGSNARVRETGVVGDKVTASETEVNYYRLLGVAYSATNREIARAYRNAMKATHPDRVAAADRQAAEERAKLLNRAYRTLTRPADRLAYDRTLRQEVVQEQIMSSYFGGMGMPGTERDRYGDAVRYQQTARDMAERTQSERSAIVTVLLIFGGATALVVGLIVIWAVASGLVRAVL